MNNSFFGKTIEDTRRYKDIKIVTNPKHFEKLVSKPTFEHMKIYEEDMAAIELKKQTVTLDKPRYFFIIYIYTFIIIYPRYVGMCILALSKEVMYEFHYNVMMPNFPDTKLFFTDTDR